MRTIAAAACVVSCSAASSTDAGDAAAAAPVVDGSADVDASPIADASPPPDASDAARDAGTSTGCSASGEAMPATDPPGWKRVFADDFAIDAPLGSFPGGAYAGAWSAYPDGWHDTSGNGHYSPERTLSVGGCVLKIDVHTENGVHYVSAPEPMAGRGQLYGRYEIRFRATRTTNDYKTAWLLWPDSDKWPGDGEIDWPEGDIGSTFSAFAHYANPAGGQDAFDTKATYTSWHTAVTEWSPGRVSFLLDGATVGTSTTQVPSKPMHYVLQTETNLDGIAPSNTSAATLEIDWVVIWAKN